MPTNYGWNHIKNSSDWTSVDPTESVDVSEEAMWELLSAYVDGEVTPEEARKVEVMLQSDPAYARDFSFLKATSQSAHTLQEVEPPAALRQNILAATTQRRSLTKRVVAAWTAMREAYLPSVGRYAVPATGVIAVAALAVVALWPRPTAPQSKDLADAPILTPKQIPHADFKRLDPDVQHKLEKYTRTEPSRTVRRTTPQPEQKHLVAVTKSKEEMAVSLEHVQQAMRVAFAPALVHKPLNVKKLTVNKAPRHTPAQKPIVVADADTGSFYARPMMDAENYHPTNVEKTEQKGIDGLDVRTDDDASVKLTSAEQNEANIREVTTTPPLTPSPRIRVARLLASQTPPDSRHILTGADIKRIRDASMLGYDTQTVESIQRKQPTIAFVSRF